MSIIQNYFIIIIMHRRSNLQTKQLAGSDSIYTYGIPDNKIICDQNNIPSAMRPYSNRMCSHYPYNTDGPFYNEPNPYSKTIKDSSTNNSKSKEDFVVTSPFLGNGNHSAGFGILNPDSMFIDSYIRTGIPVRSPDRSYNPVVMGPGTRFLELPNYYTPYLANHVIPPSYIEGGFQLGGMSTRNKGYQTVWTQ
mgnify:CR=1 FL=1